MAGQGPTFGQPAGQQPRRRFAGAYEESPAGLTGPAGASSPDVTGGTGASSVSPGGGSSLTGFTGNTPQPGPSSPQSSAFTQGLLDALLGANTPGTIAGSGGSWGTQYDPVLAEQQKARQDAQRAATNQAYQDVTGLSPNTYAPVNTQQSHAAGQYGQVQVTGWVYQGGNVWHYIKPDGSVGLRKVADASGTPLSSTQAPDAYAQLYPNTAVGQFNTGLVAQSQGATLQTGPDGQQAMVPAQPLEVLQADPAAPAPVGDAPAYQAAPRRDPDAVAAYAQFSAYSRDLGTTPMPIESWLALSDAERLAMEQITKSRWLERTSTIVFTEQEQQENTRRTAAQDAAAQQQRTEAQATTRQGLIAAQDDVNRTTTELQTAAAIFQQNPDDPIARQHYIEALAASEAATTHHTYMGLQETNFNGGGNPAGFILGLMDKPREVVVALIGQSLYDMSTGGDGGIIGGFLRQIMDDVNAGAGDVAGNVLSRDFIGLLTNLFGLSGLDDLSGSPTELVMAMMAWVQNDGNRPMIDAAYNGGYNGFTGSRAVWELFQSGRSGWQRFTSDIWTDPFTYTPGLNTFGRGIRTAAAGADNAIVRIGGQVLGGALQAPEQAGNRLFDEALGAVAGIAGNVGGSLFKPTTNTVAGDMANDRVNSLLAANQAANQIGGSAGVTPPGTFMNGQVGPGAVTPTTNPVGGFPQQPAAPAAAAAAANGGTPTTKPVNPTVPTATNNPNPPAVTPAGQAVPPITGNVAPARYSRGPNQLPAGGWTTTPGRETFTVRIQPDELDPSAGIVTTPGGDPLAARMERTPGSGQITLWYVDRSGQSGFQTFGNAFRAADWAADHADQLLDGSFADLGSKHEARRRGATAMIQNADRGATTRNQYGVIEKGLDAAYRGSPDPAVPRITRPEQGVRTRTDGSGGGDSGLPDPLEPDDDDFVPAPAASSGPAWVNSKTRTVSTPNGHVLSTSTTDDGLPQLVYPGEDGGQVVVRYIPEEPDFPYVVSYHKGGGGTDTPSFANSEPEALALADQKIAGNQMDVQAYKGRTAPDLTVTRTPNGFEVKEVEVSSGPFGLETATFEIAGMDGVAVRVVWSRRVGYQVVTPDGKALNRIKGDTFTEALSHLDLQLTTSGYRPRVVTDAGIPKGEAPDASPGGPPSRTTGASNNGYLFKEFKNGQKSPGWSASTRNSAYLEWNPERGWLLLAMGHPDVVIGDPGLSKQAAFDLAGDRLKTLGSGYRSTVRVPHKGGAAKPANSPTRPPRPIHAVDELHAGSNGDRIDISGVVLVRQEAANGGPRYAGADGVGNRLYLAQEQSGAWVVILFDPEDPAASRVFRQQSPQGTEVLIRVQRMVVLPGMHNFDDTMIDRQVAGLLPDAERAKLEAAWGAPIAESAANLGPPPNKGLLDEAPDDPEEVLTGIVMGDDGPVTLPGERLDAPAVPRIPTPTPTRQAIMTAVAQPELQEELIDALVPPPAQMVEVVHPETGQVVSQPVELSPEGEVLYHAMQQAAEAGDPGAEVLVAAMGVRQTDEAAARMVSVRQLLRDVVNRFRHFLSGLDPDGEADLIRHTAATIRKLEAEHPEYGALADDLIPDGTVYGEGRKMLAHLPAEVRQQYDEYAIAVQLEYRRTMGTAYRKDTITPVARAKRSIEAIRQNLRFATFVHNQIGDMPNHAPDLAGMARAQSRQSPDYLVRMAVYGDAGQRAIGRTKLELLFNSPEGGVSIEHANMLLDELADLHVAATTPGYVPDPWLAIDDMINPIAPPLGFADAAEAVSRRRLPRTHQPAPLGENRYRMGDTTITASGNTVTVNWVGDTGPRSRDFPTAEAAFNWGREIAWARYGRELGYPGRIGTDADITDFAKIGWHRRFDRAAGLPGVVDRKGTITSDEGHALFELAEQQGVIEDLGPGHTEWLRGEQGLTPADVLDNGFVQMPNRTFSQRVALLNQLSKQAQRARDFVWRTAPGARGEVALVQPFPDQTALGLKVTDASGRVRGIVFRNSQDGGEKYRLMAGNFAPDNGALPPVHVYQPAAPNPRGRVWIVNGQFKAVYAGVRLNEPVLGLHGYSGSNLGVDLAALQANGQPVNQVVIAFDSTATSDAHIKRVVRELEGQTGAQVVIAKWDSANARGLDNAIDHQLEIAFYEPETAVLIRRSAEGTPRGAKAPATLAEQKIRKAEQPSRGTGGKGTKVRDPLADRSKTRAGRVHDVFPANEQVVYVASYMANPRITNAAGTTAGLWDMPAWKNAEAMFRFKLDDGTEVPIPWALGNPPQIRKAFKIPADSVPQYGEYLMANPELMAQLPKLRGKNIVCWCGSPGHTGGCHAGLIEKILNKFSDADLLNWTVPGKNPDAVANYQAIWREIKEQATEKPYHKRQKGTTPTRGEIKENQRIAEQDARKRNARGRQLAKQHGPETVQGMARRRGFEVDLSTPAGMRVNQNTGVWTVNGTPYFRVVPPRAAVKDPNVRRFVQLLENRLTQAIQNSPLREQGADKLMMHLTRVAETARRNDPKGHWVTEAAAVLNELNPGDPWAQDLVRAGRRTQEILSNHHVQTLREMAEADMLATRVRPSEPLGAPSFEPDPAAGDMVGAIKEQNRLRAEVWADLGDIWARLNGVADAGTGELTKADVVPLMDAKTIEALEKVDPATAARVRQHKETMRATDARLRQLLYAPSTYDHNAGRSGFQRPQSLEDAIQREMVAERKLNEALAEAHAWLEEDLTGPFLKDQADYTKLHDRQRRGEVLNAQEQLRYELLRDDLPLREKRLRDVLSFANSDSKTRTQWFNHSRRGDGYGRAGDEWKKRNRPVSVTDPESRAKAQQLLDRVMTAMRERQQIEFEIELIGDPRFAAIREGLERGDDVRELLAPLFDEAANENAALGRIASADSPMEQALTEAPNLGPIEMPGSTPDPDPGTPRTREALDAFAGGTAIVDATPDTLLELSVSGRGWAVELTNGYEAPYTGQLFLHRLGGKTRVYYRHSDGQLYDLGGLTHKGISDKSFQTSERMRALVAEKLNGLWAEAADTHDLDSILTQIGLPVGQGGTQSLGGVGAGIGLASTAAGDGMMGNPLIDVAAGVLGQAVDHPVMASIAGVTAAAIPAWKITQARVRAYIEPPVKIRSGMRPGLSPNAQLVERAIARGSVDPRLLPLSVADQHVLNQRFAQHKQKTLFELVNTRLRAQYGTNIGSATPEQLLAQYDYVNFLIKEEYGWLPTTEHKWLNRYDTLRAAYSEVALLMPWAAPRQIVSNTIMGNLVQVVIGGQASALRHMNVRNFAAMARYAYHGDEMYTSPSAHWAERFFGGWNAELTGSVKNAMLVGTQAGKGSVLREVGGKVGLGWVGKPAEWTGNLITAIEWSFRTSVFEFHARQGVQAAWPAMRDRVFKAVDYGMTVSRPKHAVKGAPDIVRVKQGLSELLAEAATPAELQVALGNLLIDQGVKKSNAYKISHALATDWANILTTIRRDAQGQVDSVLFRYRATKADELLSRFVPFHFYMTRSIPFFAQHLLRHPAGAAAMYRGMEAMKREAEQNHWPSYMQKYVAALQGPWGLFLAVNPLAALGFIDLFMQEEGGWDQNRNGLEKFINGLGNNVGLQFYPWLLAPLAYAGFLGSSTRYLDPIGTNGIRKFLGAGVQLLAAHGLITGEPTILGQPFMEALTWIQGLTSGILPGSKEYGHRDLEPAELVRNLVLQQVMATEGMSEQDFYLGLADLNAGIDSPRARLAQQVLDAATLEYEQQGTVYDEAVQQYSSMLAKGQILNAFVGGGTVLAAQGDLEQGAIRDQGLSAVGVTGAPPVPAGDSREEQVANALADPAWTAAYTDATGNPATEENIAGYIDATQGTDSLMNIPPEAQSMVQANDAYQNIGTAEVREHWGVYWSLVFGNAEFEGTIAIGGRLWTAEQINLLPQASRSALAEQYYALHNTRGELDTYRTERDQFLEDHPDYAAFQQWQSEMRKAWQDTGGAREYRRRVSMVNPGAAQYWEEQRASIRAEHPDWNAAQVEQELDNRTFTFGAYMAIAGLPIFDGAPVGNGMGLDLLPPGMVAGAASAVVAGGQPGRGANALSATTVGLAVEETQTAIAAAEDFLEQTYGYEQVDYDHLPPPVRASLDQQLAAAGFMLPENAWIAESYLAWKSGREATGREASYETFAALYNSNSLPQQQDDFFTPMPGGWGFNMDFQGNDPMALPAGVGYAPEGSYLGANIAGSGSGSDPVLDQLMLAVANGELDGSVLALYQGLIADGIPAREALQLLIAQMGGGI